MSVAQKNYWCYTHGQLYSFKYTWVIKNFTFYAEESCLESSVFYVGAADDESKCRLYLGLKEKYGGEDKDHFSLYLHLVSSKKMLRVILKCAVLNSKKVEKNIFKFPNAYQFYSSSKKGFPQFIKKGFLYDESNDLLPENTLTIFCEGNIISDTDVDSGEYNMIRIPESKLSEDFMNLFKTEKFCDVIFVLSDQEIKAHKIILAARSQVFSAMFSHEMNEQQSNRVLITDMDFDVFKEMLHFIYTEQAPNLDQMANDLLAAADKYQMEKLKALSEDAIYAKLRIENAADTLVLADRYSADQLKEYTIDFIKHNTAEVLETKGWKNVMAADMNLAAEVLLTITEKH